MAFFETVETPQGPVRFPGVPTWFSRTPGKVAGPTPLMGQDPDDNLAELGEERARRKLLAQTPHRLV